MNTARAHRNGAFTIIELLVVISIIAIIAALVVGLAGHAGESKKRKRTEVELARLVTLIDSYKSKVGFYPPRNTNFNSLANSLLYELSGARRNADADPLYTTPFGDIRASLLLSAFGMSGIVNAIDVSANSEDAMTLKPILKDLKPDQVQADRVAPNTRSLVVPVDGLDGKPALWNYRVGSGDATHNPESYDLWVEIVLGRTNGVPRTKIIGNWKD